MQNLKRITISLDNNHYKKLKILQSNHIEVTHKHLSFSKTLGFFLVIGLLKLKMEKKKKKKKQKL